MHEFAWSLATGCGGHPSSTNLGERMTFVERRPYGGSVWRSLNAAHHPQIEGERMTFEERRPLNLFVFGGSGSILGSWPQVAMN